MNYSLSDFALEHPVSSHPARQGQHGEDREKGERSRVKEGKGRVYSRLDFEVKRNESPWSEMLVVFFQVANDFCALAKYYSVLTGDDFSCY